MTTGPVLLVNNSGTFGGAELYLERLMTARPPDVGMRLAARDPSPPRLLEAAAAAGVPVTRWRPGPAGLLRLYREMRGAGLVHLNMAWGGDHAHALALAWPVRRPVVGTVHIWVRPRSSLRRRVMALGYRRLRRVIAVSAEIRDAVVDQLGVPAGRVDVVPNGVPFAEPPVRDPHETVVIGALGRLVPAKGFDLLIEAVGRLRDRGHHLEAVIAGEGPERDALERAAEGLPVRLAGFVTDVGAFLGGVDVFCLPSRWEGLPFALLEAMMAGAPCVAAGVGDVAMGVGATGRIVPPDDVDALTSALEELVASPELRAQLGRAAHERARDRFGMDAFVAGTLAVYDKALSRQGRSRDGGGPGAGAAGAARRRPAR
ncbi:MAG: glycosyltransferase family 4 protein [Acidimicrobiales bacterium]